MIIRGGGISSKYGCMYNILGSWFAVCPAHGGWNPCSPKRALMSVSISQSVSMYG